MTDPTRDYDSHDEAPAPEMFQYKLDDDADGTEVEDLGNYVPGGYHPVALGDVLGDSGRFRVVHKLGFGGYATVWLCHDNESKKWRTVKVMAAHASTPDCADLRALELFSGTSLDLLAANRVQLALEHFWVDGPNGRHLCFVLPFLGPGLSTVYHLYGHVPELMKDICFQLVEALEFIHSRGLCHGDFRPDNILFRLADGVDEWDEEEIMKLLGQPDLARVERVDGTEADMEPGVPTYLVERSHIEYGSGACSSEIAVIDYGVSYRASEPPVGKGTGITLPYAAPEALFSLDNDLGFHSDVWSLGVTIAKVRCGLTPFADERYDTMLEGLEKMESILGPLPEPYRSIWKGWDGVFVNCQDENGGLRQDDDSWKDESVPATVCTESEESTRQARVMEGRHPNHLQLGLIMHIDDEEAADIAAQAASNPGRLPAYKYGQEAHRLSYEQQVRYTMTDAEIKQLFDFFLAIFTWHPEERPTLNQIAGHEWFGDRHRRRQLAAAAPASPPPLKAVNTKRARSPSPLRPGKKSRVEIGKSGEEVRGSGIVKNVWASWSLYRGRIGLGLRKGAGCITRFFSWAMGKITRIISGTISTMGGFFRGDV
ncbi:kinase-like domain-containing protein [Parachaetomium inaequale]|uniref:EKC/KEOPS complex subunit BUD32 n=1 Tax=Parachaetomium inaequale TaxID=2588326 RepID=A0AAN6PEJ4_9PEZI|nr:kinase-like domain-containing protein [Parachaetomium inaequale]